MKLRLSIALMIFMGSYLPLSVILLAQNYDYTAFSRPLCLNVWSAACNLPLKNPVMATCIFIVCLVCFSVTLLALWKVPVKERIELSEIEHVPADLISYTLPYIVSFMSMDYQEIGKFVGVIFFLGWMFWITFKSGQIILNPVLVAFGWRFYNVTYTFPPDTKHEKGSLLAHGLIETGKSYSRGAIQSVLIVRN